MQLELANKNVSAQCTLVSRFKKVLYDICYTKFCYVTIKNIEKTMVKIVVTNMKLVDSNSLHDKLSISGLELILENFR